MIRLRIALMSVFLIGPIAVAAAPVVAHAATCTAQAPGAYPNDPDFAPAENNPSSGNTWDGEDWYLYGCIPQSAPQSTDPNGMSGMDVAGLWNRAGTPQRGRDDVVIAYMEGGVNWRIGSSCELKDRAKLNTGELPYPQDASGLDHGTYDLNGDTFVNVEDYINDPRVLAAVASPSLKSPPGGLFLHHVCAGRGSANSAGYAPTDITPEDLIVAFGHCQITAHEIGAQGCPAGGRFDNDGNGYRNDINGWNFNRDNNDPQTEQSIYGHFDGESGQAVGEGNNANSSIGLCPLCRYVPIKAGDEAIDRPDRVAEAIVFAANTGVNVMDVTSASLGLNQTVQAAINYAYAKGMVVVFASNDFDSADHTDGMYYANVWPGNSLTGDHSTRNGATCPPAPNSNDAFCAFVSSNNTFLSRSSLTSFGPHALFSTPNTDGSTSTGTPTNAGVAALVVAEGKSAAGRAEITSPLTANEVRQVVRATATPISAPCPSTEFCFTGPAGASFNIQYGYGRPNLTAAASLIDAGHIPPSANLDSPGWYKLYDPMTQAAVPVSADVSAQREGGAYNWVLQYGLGPQPLDSAWHTFASGSKTGPATVSGSLALSQIPSSFWNAAYSIDPNTRLSIEKYDVSIRVQVFANNDRTDSWAKGEDRRAIHVHHDASLLTGTAIDLGSSGDASPTMADIEGRGWLDTIIPTSDGSVHVIRPDGKEAPGFPVHTDPAIGMRSGYAANYLSDPTWANSVVPRPRDPIFSTAAVGDVHKGNTGALDIVASTSAGYTFVWDGLGHRLPGFPVLNGKASQFGLTVPPPDTPYSFEPENYTAASPVLAHLILGNNPETDIIQAAGDNHIYAWRPDGTAVPGWPVSTLLPPGTVPSGQQQTHDSKVVPTPATIDINGDGIPDVVVGLDDTVLGTGPSGTGVVAFLEAFDGRGTSAAGPVPGNAALLNGYPVKIQGLLQGYGVAQDFVTQGVESPAIYRDPARGPMAVVNANLFLPFTVNLATHTVPSNPYPATTIPSAPAGEACPTPGSVPPTFPGPCALVQFTTSASLGKLTASAPTPDAFQMGSSSADVFLGITQTPGYGIRVDNGVGAWDPTSGSSLSQFSHYVQGLSFFAAPAVADVTGDGTPDVIVPGDSGAVSGFDGASGQPATGYPKYTGGWSVFTPAVGDVAGSGHTDVAAMTREGSLFIWTSAGNGCAGNNEAWHWHQNDWNNGRYGEDTRPPSAISDLTVTQSGASDILKFTAVGDNWKCGTPAGYQLLTSSSPITQYNAATATRISLSAGCCPGAAGTKETITIAASANKGYLAIRAIDGVKRLGPLRLTTTTPPLSAQFSVAIAPSIVVAVLALAGLVAPRRRRRFMA